MTDGQTEPAEQLRLLLIAVQSFLDNCPQMEEFGDSEDCVEELCLETGLRKPCYGDQCSGCDQPSPQCASPDVKWRPANESVLRSIYTTQDQPKGRNDD